MKIARKKLIEAADIAIDSLRFTPMITKDKLSLDEAVSATSLCGRPTTDVAHAKFKYYWDATVDFFALATLVGGTSSGIKFYPRGGHLSWHTNSDVPGRRFYAVFSYGPGSYFFNGDECIKEPTGWTFRSFETPVWHSVLARDFRLAIGFHVSQEIIVTG